MESNIDQKDFNQYIKRINKEYFICNNNSCITEKNNGQIYKDNKIIRSDDLGINFQKDNLEKRKKILEREDDFLNENLFNMNNYYFESDNINEKNNSHNNIRENNTQRNDRNSEMIKYKNNSRLSNNSKINRYSNPIYIDNEDEYLNSFNLSKNKYNFNIDDFSNISKDTANDHKSKIKKLNKSERNKNIYNYDNPEKIMNTGNKISKKTNSFYFKKLDEAFRETSSCCKNRSPTNRTKTIRIDDPKYKFSNNLDKNSNKKYKNIYSHTDYDFDNSRVNKISDIITKNERFSNQMDPKYYLICSKGDLCLAKNKSNNFMKKCYNQIESDGLSEFPTKKFQN